MDTLIVYELILVMIYHRIDMQIDFQLYFIEKFNQMDQNQ